jgi:hypothetical protein
MKIWRFSFPASWLGGNAVVQAPSSGEAYIILKKHYAAIPPIMDCNIEEVTGKSILYFSDGNY